MAQTIYKTQIDFVLKNLMHLSTQSTHAPLYVPGSKVIMTKTLAENLPFFSVPREGDVVLLPKGHLHLLNRNSTSLVNTGKEFTTVAEDSPYYKTYEGVSAKPLFDYLTEKEFFPGMVDKVVFVPALPNSLRHTGTDNHTEALIQVYIHHYDYPIGIVE